MQRIIFRDSNITIFQSQLFQTNSTVVVTDDVVLVVDPAWLPDEVMEIRNYVNSVKAGRPVFLIFTHSDYDHILGYGAFNPDKIFVTKAFDENPNKQEIIDQIIDFDHNYYVNRPYPILYPQGTFLVFKDGVQFRQGQTRLTFYMAPGHTADSMMIIVWQLGLCVAGDYLSNIEFPFIYHSSVEYEKTLNKLPLIHDRNWFTKLVPGHGEPALTINDWLRRRTEALAYIYTLRECVATGAPFDEDSLWFRYKFPRLQRHFHLDNLALVQAEFERGDWQWDESLSYDLFHKKRKPVEPLMETYEQTHEEFEEDDDD